MASKKFLFVSYIALAGDLARTLRNEGHQVRFYIQDKNAKDVYDGFFDKVDDWKVHIDWADVIVFDDVLGMGKEAEKLRKQGKLVIGGTTYTDMLEDDRGFGQEEMKKVGINILPVNMFTDFDEAVRFVEKNPDRYVLKPSGKAEDKKELLFIGQEEDGKDVISVLRHYKPVWSKLIKEFQLQRFASGVEVAVGAFFNGKKFIHPINVNFEHKRLFPGDLGPQTGEMGEVMFWSEPNKLFNSTLTKMEPKLREVGYVGYVDINCIVNGKGIYPLEFTARFGYPTLEVQLEGILMPASEWILKLTKGEDFELKTKKGFQIGARILVPSFFAEATDKKLLETYRDLPIIFKNENKLDGIHIEDVKLVDGDWRIAGDSGVLLVVAGSGTTLEEARESLYNRIKNIMVPNMFYRIDIGERCKKDIERLMAWGYI